MRIIVSDASTLILLQKIALLNKLAANFNLIIPMEVYNESVIKGKSIKSEDAYSIEDKINNNLIKIKDIKDKKRVDRIIKEFGLGKGEAEAVVSFLQEKADVLATDDHKAINICKIHKIPFITALTFVVEAHKIKLVNKSKAKEMIKNLGIYGRYRDELIYKALNCIGEKND